MIIDVLLVLAIVLFIFLMMRNRREQQRRAASLQSSLVPGARVMTTTGLHASIVSVSETTVDLEVAPGVVTTWAKAAVARRVDDTATAPAQDVPPADPDTFPETSPSASSAGDDVASPAPAAPSSTSGTSSGDPERPAP